MTRLASIVIIAVGLALLLVPPTRRWTSIAGVIAIVAAVATLRGGVGAASPALSARTATPPPSPKKPQTALVATVTSPASTERSIKDLQRILAGIITDERGRLMSSNGGPIVATFGSASAAIHAARRMMSNVDALGRRLDRLIALSVGIDNTIDEATRLERLTHEKRIAVLVGVATATLAENASLAPLEDGLYSFTPLQQRHRSCSTSVAIVVHDVRRDEVGERASRPQ
jgi:hypothetical protein